jgi:hypothetical protein
VRSTPEAIDLLGEPVPTKLAPRRRRGRMTLNGPVNGARLRVLSLGAGIQSTTMALMAAHGEIAPMPDLALFADTGEEPAPVLETVRWLASGNVLPFPVRTISAGRALGDILDRSERSGRFVTMPFFTACGGQARRQCTREFKTEVLEREQRRLLGHPPRQRILPGSCEVWIGFTTDELIRAGDAFAPWVVNRYPLIEARMDIGACVRWLERHDYPVPMRSRCVCCPYRSDADWLDLQARDPAGFARAVQLDEAIRHSAGMRELGFLHASRRPLREVVFRYQDQGRLDLVCDGDCGT